MAFAGIEKATLRLRRGHSILVTGGARSGKSRFAENLAGQKQRVAYLATAEVLDGEMKERIQRHRQGRNPSWHTIEEPLEVLGSLKSSEMGHDVILIDCITLWISNLLAANLDDEQITRRVSALAEYLSKPSASVICVTNEVGSGVVPSYPLGRRFRDMAGQTNQCLAQACSHVVWLLSGIPVQVK